MPNLNFIKDVRSNTSKGNIFNELYHTVEQLDEMIEQFRDDENVELAKKYEEVKTQYNVPLIVKNEDTSDLFEVLEINDDTTNEELVEFCLDDRDKKDYSKISLTELDNYKEIDSLDDLYDMQVESEYGVIYIDTVDNALWLQDLANAYKYLNDLDIDWSEHTINDYDDVIKLAE